jgi:hypothetical protein
MRRRGIFASLVALLLLCAAVVYGVAAVTAPWAFHIGGRWTPLLYWSGSGTLHTKGGAYPLYVTIYPSSSFSRLHLDGLRPSGGVQGSGSLCTSRGAILYLKLGGTIYNGWRSTAGSFIQFRLLEPKYIDVGQKQGFFDLYGRWHGPQLVMDARGESAVAFRSGLRIDQASVTLAPGAYSDFKALCANATSFSTRR